MNPYLDFNSSLNNNIYDILFHDNNPLANHFEPILCKSQINGINSQQDKEMPTKYENIEEQWKQIQIKMLTNGLERVQTFTSAYGESCFETICHLTNHEYDVPCLRCIVAQTFCNAIMKNYSFSIRCIEKYVKIEIQKMFQE